MSRKNTVFLHFIGVNKKAVFLSINFPETRGVSWRDFSNRKMLGRYCRIVEMASDTKLLTKPIVLFAS
jgi:hypothetical protein